jgi:predicted RNase H-like HicB family nuclease
LCIAVLLSSPTAPRAAVANAEDALTAVIEGYHDLGRPLPAFLQPVALAVP